MNKKTKALVTAAAGVAVLAASGATFALWQDETGIGEDALSTGVLRLNEASVSWQDISQYRLVDGSFVPGGVTNPGPWDPASDLLVPQDTVRGTLSAGGAASLVEFSADAPNLAWELTLDDDALASTVNAVPGATITVTPVDADGDGTVDAIDVFFDAQGTDAQDVQAVSLAGAQLVVRQVRS